MYGWNCPFRQFQPYRSKEFIIIDLLTIYDKGEISNISDEFISFLLDKRENG